MSEIFISYVKGDIYKAELLAKMLEKEGFSVFWDRHLLLGPAWEQTIKASLHEARCVIVLWSRKSARLRWVQKEAEAGAQRNTLIPVLISGAKIPPEFDKIETVKLVGWDGNTSHAGFQQILSLVKAKLARPGQDESEKTQSDAARQPDVSIARDPLPAPAVAESIGDDTARQPGTSSWTISETELPDAVLEVETQRWPPAAPAPTGRGTGWKAKVFVSAAAAVALGIWASMQWISTRDNRKPSVGPVTSAPFDNPVAEEPVYQEPDVVPEVVEDLPRGPAHASDYYEHENGAFQYEGEEWVEYSWDPAAASFAFEETGRDADWIYLYDASRDVDVALPMGEGYCLISEPDDTEWRQLYYLTIPE